MKRYILVILFFASFLVGAKAQKKAKVVFIIVDGISADIMEENDLPNLKEISRAGGYISAYQGGEKGLYNESPTISAVGYNNVLTGVWYNKHNVEDNYIKNPNYNYPTLFKLVKNSNPDKKLAIFSSWIDNRTKLIGEGLEQTKNIKLDYIFDGYERDTIRFPLNSKDYMSLIDECRDPYGYTAFWVL